MKHLLLVVSLLSGSALAQDVDGGVPPGTLPLPEATLTPDGAPVSVTASARDGFSISSADGNWGLRIGGVFWSSFTETVTPTTSQPHFAIPLARLQLRAHLFRPWLKVFFQPEFAVTPRVLDLEFIAQPWDEFGVKVGQLQPAFSRAWLSPVPKLQFQGFTPANTVFRPDRQAGALVFGSFFEGRLEYFAGVFDGNGINKTANDNRHMMWNARIAGTLFGAAPNTKAHVRYDETAHLAGTMVPTLQIGIDGYVDRLTPSNAFADPPLPDQEQQVASADLSFTWKRFFAQTEGYLMRMVPVGGARPTVVRSGFDVQAGFFIIQSVLELAGRFSWLHYDNHTAGAWVVQGDGQLNYYVAGNNLKIGARYSATATANPAATGYAASLTHTIFVQIQVWL